MAMPERMALIHRIEQMRGSAVICYLTSLRPGVDAKMAEDAVRVFLDHLLALPFPNRPEKIDLFLCSNGGDTTVPWRLVPLFREFATSFNVLVPYHAYSAATLLALGADEIVMTPFAVLGPIDPTVGNAFNPKDEVSKQTLGISVEDVQAYLNFIKTTVGISQDDQLIKAIQILAEKVHPLALGNVDRILSQSRMLARKIMNTHMAGAAERDVAEIIENMASKLYFHGHPINRKEARQELRLKVAECPPLKLEGAMWELYKDYEQEFQNTDLFNPFGDLAAGAGPPTGPPVIPGLPPGMTVGPTAGTSTHTYDLLFAVVESARLSSRYVTQRRCTLVTGPGGRGVLQEDLRQGWASTPVQQIA
jgi:hypothetical protein